MANTLLNGVVESSNIDPASLGGFAYASSVRQTYKVADETALNALGDMETGDLAFRLDEAAYYFYNGTQWRIWYTTRPINFTPVWQGVNVGNGTLLYARQTVDGSTKTAEVALKFGTTTTIGGEGTVGVSYPPAANFANLQEFQDVGRSWFYDAAGPGGSFLGVCSHRAAGFIIFDGMATNGVDARASIRQQGISPTFPFNWTVNDVLVARWSWLAS